MTSIGTNSDSFAKHTDDYRHPLSDSLKDPSATPSQHDHIPAPRVHRLPDLRFEQSYLRSVRPYVNVERISVEELGRDEKGKAVAVEDASPREVIQVQWNKVLWITTRDQVISPLLQGALWYVSSLSFSDDRLRKTRIFGRGVAGHFLRPMFASFFRSFKAWWSKGGIYSPGPRPEGQGAGKLRGWVEGLTAPGAVRHDLTR
ncbi:hypothetical protein NLI96_g4747 [Meripilus lineatus]|uniref:Uncharacterized protein n=1 Tax=Meripilus lineatus TaxID=2056292 RepID=A0AAD5V616_9APHY|nr:hypothetical protein NLI96_g4747 [Physisporinus lineatus]